MSGETSHQEHIGPYRLLSRLGGGAGVAYRAADASGRDVAIRTLQPAAEPPQIERMGGVLSPYVVDVLGGDPAARPPYVVSRFVPGRPLEETLAEHGALRGEALRRLAIGLAKGLAAIHRAGLAHGDLGPKNVLVVDGAPVIVDFALTPGTAAADVHAWAATVTFAATAAGGGVPEVLVPLLRAATAPDPAVRPSAAELAEAVTALDLGPSPDPVPAPRPAPLVPPPAAPEPEPEAAAPVPSRATAHELAVAQGWSRLLSVLVVVIAAGIAIMAPVLGLVLSVGAVALLRLLPAASARERLLALGRTAATLPYAAVFVVAVPLGLAALSVLRVEIDPLGACSFGAGAGAVVLWAAPGVRGPRRQLERMFLAAAASPRWIAAAGIGLGLLAFLSLVGAMSLTPSFAPLYGWQSSLENSIGSLQSALH